MVLFYPVVLHVVIWGIIIDSRLSFIERNNSMVAKAHTRAMRQILRCFLSRDPLNLIRAFNVCVRPIVEYCSPVWSTTAVGKINKKLNRYRGGSLNESNLYSTLRLTSG